MPDSLALEPSTRRRVLALLLASLLAYALAIVLLGIAVGFDHAAERWLLAAAFIFLAVGLGASALMRLFLFVFDAKSRAWWWGQASVRIRVLRVASLLVRGAAVIVLLDVAVGALRD